MVFGNYCMHNCVKYWLSVIVSSRCIIKITIRGSQTFARQGAGASPTRLTWSYTVCSAYFSMWDRERLAGDTWGSLWNHPKDPCGLWIPFVPQKCIRGFVSCSIMCDLHLLPAERSRPTQMWTAGSVIRTQWCPMGTGTAGTAPIVTSTMASRR